MARLRRAKSLDFTIHSIDFEVHPVGFGSRVAALEGALARVQFMLAACTAEELGDHRGSMRSPLRRAGGERELALLAPLPNRCKPAWKIHIA